MPFNYVMSLCLEQVQDAHDECVKIKALERLHQLENINLGYNGGAEANKLMKQLYNIAKEGITTIPVNDEKALLRDLNKLGKKGI